MNLDTLLSGFLGGAMLGAARMILSLPVVMGIQDMKFSQFIASHCLLAFLLGLVGAAVAWELDGRAAGFVEGIGALSFLTLLGADSPSSLKRGNETK